MKTPTLISAATLSLLLSGCASDPFGPDSYSDASQAEASTADTAPDNPSTPAPTRYDASGEVRCATQSLTLDQQCAYRVVRGDEGSAEIWLAPVMQDSDDPEAGGQRVLRFADDVFSSGDGVPITWERQDDNWLVGVAGATFYLLPDALIQGG